MKSLDKHSFTLLEVIIVLVVMGFVYTLSITSFSKQTIQKHDNYFNLKSILLKSAKTKNKEIELIVFDDDSYIVTINDKESKKIKLKLPKSIEFYRYNQDGEQKEKFEPYYKDGYFKTVKFRFKIYKNGSSTKAIVKLEDKYFIQSSYFKDRSYFFDLYEAQEYLLQDMIKQSMVQVDE